MRRFTDYSGRSIRLTDERLEHIERRPEMENQRRRIGETLAEPDEVRRSDHDNAIHLYYQHYDTTPVTEKFLLVVTKVVVDDPFVITAFYTDRLKSGERIYPEK